jgi:hypothetical protein
VGVGGKMLEKGWNPTMEAEAFSKGSSRSPVWHGFDIPFLLYRSPSRGIKFLNKPKRSMSGKEELSSRD